MAAIETKLTYLEESYTKTATATVVEIDSSQPQTIIILDQTIFYAQGGGQPADTGTITGETGVFSVKHVSYNGGAVAHKGTLEGEIKVGEEVTLEIDWEQRYRHMQLHTAGHILDQAVKNVLPSNLGVDGDHGIGKRSFVAFNSVVEASQLEEIAAEIKKIIAADLPISAQMVSLEYIQYHNITLPFELPKNKKLRLVQIGDYPEMPDGGTQLKSTAETWPIEVTHITEKNGQWRVHYQVSSAETTAGTTQEASTTTSVPLESIKDEAKKLIENLTSATATPNQLKTEYLGKKGHFNQLAKQISEVAAEDRKELGQILNQLKNDLEKALASKHTSTSSPDWVDLTAPGTKPQAGHLHPISQAMEDITRIFQKIGFTRVRYPEVDWDWYVFESLNMPPDHPARDEWETFFVDAPRSKDKGNVVLTTHTSNGQVREMERLNSTPPIRMINIARCYRRQQDATHTQMFHQFEGLVVDKGITIQHLKGTLDHFAREFYGEGVKSRIRPFHFQFTEPSFEVDFSCHICAGTGIKEGEKCKFCKNGWHEVGGSGMVHPNVLRAGGIDPDEYTGFAFGWGVERTYTLKEGLNIDDIRLLYSSNLEFLEQF